MRVFNLIVHILTAVVMIGNGAILFVSSLLLIIAAGLFHGNASGLIMAAGAIVVLVAGVMTIKTAFADSSLLQVDKAAYVAQETKLALVAIAFTAVATLVLLLFNSFSVSDVFEYGFGGFLYGFGAVAALNVASCVLTRVLVR